MIEIEGIVAVMPGAAQVDAMMRVEIVLSPWWLRGADEVGVGAVHLEIPMNVDEADAWLTQLDPGDCVGVSCVALVAASPTRREGRGDVRTLHTAGVPDVLAAYLAAQLAARR